MKSRNNKDRNKSEEIILRERDSINNLIKDKNFDKAIESINILFASYEVKLDIRISMLLGRSLSYKMTGNNIAAISDDIEIIDIFENNKSKINCPIDIIDDVCINIAKAYFSNSTIKDYNKTKEYLDKISNKGRRTLSYLAILGPLYNETGEYNKALNISNKCIELNANQAEYYHNRGLAYSNIGNDIEARKDFEKALTIDKNLFESKVMLVMIDIRNFKLKKAEESLKEIFKLHNNIAINNAYYLETAATLYAMQQDSKRAEIFLQKAYKLDSYKISIQTGLASYYLSNGNIKEFEEMYFSLEKRAPANEAFLSLKCQYLYSLGKKEEFKKILSTLRNTYPNVLSYTITEIDGCFLDRDYKKAEEISNNALKLYPNHPLLLEFLGKSFLYRGQYEQSKQYLLESYSILDSSNSIKQALGEYYLIIEDYKQSIEYYNKVNDLKRSSDIKIINNLGVCYYNLGEYDKAVELFKQGLSINSNDSNLHKNLGMAYFAKEDNEETIKSFNKSIELNPLNIFILQPVIVEINTIIETSKNQKEYNDFVEEQKIISSKKKDILEKVKVKPRKASTDLELKRKEISKQVNDTDWKTDSIKVSKEEVSKLSWSGFLKEKSTLNGYLDKNSKEISKLTPKQIEDAESLLVNGLITSRWLGQKGIKIYPNCIAVIKNLGNNGKGDIRIWGEKIKNANGEGLFIFNHVGRHK